MINVLVHQAEFVSDMTTRYLALCGGYGSGKSKALALKCIALAAANTGHEGVLLSPTFGMARRTIIPAFEDCLDEVGVKYKNFKSEGKYVLYFPGGASTTVHVLSAENHERIRGMNLAFACVDEIDTMKKDLAILVWQQLQARLRSGKVYQMAAASTPEGFAFMYEFFVEQAIHEDGTAKADRRLIRAKTADNVYLPPEYITSLKENYPSNLIEAYLNGEFVNLASGSVYYDFDRKENETKLTLRDFPANQYSLHIGMDFNINHMAAVIAVIKDGVPYFVDEVIDATNTEDMCKKLVQKCRGYRCAVYPDASGSRSYSSSTISDHVMLKQWGFEVKSLTQNPKVRDRIASVNTMIKNAKGVRRFYVNPLTCKTLCNSLEKQGYDDRGEPDKSGGLDHVLDAAGYFIYFVWPMKKGGTMRVLN